MEETFTITLEPIEIGWEYDENKNEYSKRYRIEFDSTMDFYRGDKLYCSKFEGDFDEYELHVLADDGFNGTMCKREWLEPFQFGRVDFLKRITLVIFLKDMNKLKNRKSYTNDSKLELTCERKIYSS